MKAMLRVIMVMSRMAGLGTTSRFVSGKKKIDGHRDKNR